VHRDLKFRTTKEAVNETRFASHPFHRTAQLMSQMREVETAQMAQFDPSELLPEALVQVQLRPVGPDSHSPVGPSVPTINFRGIHIGTEQRYRR
jgi:hypothetical protein